MAEEEVYIDSDTLVEVTGLRDAESGDYINDATIKMSLFEGDELNISCCELAFTSGGAAEPVAGNILKGVTSSATATIKSVILTSGTWAEGDAVGIFEIVNRVGTFTAGGENLDLYGAQGNLIQLNVATIAAAAFTSGAETANEGAKTKLRIRRHTLTTDSYIYIQGSVNYDGYHTPSAVELDKITIDVAFVAEDTMGDEVVFEGISGATNISLTHEEGDAEGYYDGILPDDMVGLVNDNYYWRIILITKATSILTVKQRCRAIYFLEVD